MRSLLFVPADSPRKLEKAIASGADALIVDLEDSVAPAAKPDARQAAAEFLATRRHADGPLLYIRINDLNTGLTDDDLAAVMRGRPDGIVLPKAQGGQDVSELSARLRVLEAECDIEDGATKILPIVTETAIGVLSAATYRDRGARLAAITWGAEDLSAEIGARTTRDEDGRYTDVFRFARTVTLLAASAAEVDAIDTVFPNFRDMDAFRRECLEAERDGFTGRMAIHPAQVPVINEAFRPSPETLEKSAAIVEAFAAAGNTGVVSIDGEMVDQPHLKRARRILARAGRSS